MFSDLEISDNLRRIEGMLPPGVGLVAVSKFQPVDALKAAYGAGQRKFGESRVQELLEKIPQLPSDMEWHFIGHLQTNKVRALIGKTSLIESVDSIRLLELIDSESSRQEVKTDVLLQVHVAREETKFGFSKEELCDLMKSYDFARLQNVEIRGVMAMATNTGDISTVRRDFEEAASIFREISQSGRLRRFDLLSMGMSGDWPIAVEEGANLVRIGSAIFGSRQ